MAESRKSHFMCFHIWAPAQCIMHVAKLYKDMCKKPGWSLTGKKALLILLTVIFLKKKIILRGLSKTRMYAVCTVNFFVSKRKCTHTQTNKYTCLRPHTETDSGFSLAVSYQRLLEAVSLGVTPYPWCWKGCLHFYHDYNSKVRMQFSVAAAFLAVMWGEWDECA